MKQLQFEFYKDPSGWYIDFPGFIENGLGNKEDLAMVAGADNMLEYLSQGNSRISLTFSDLESSEARFKLMMRTKNQWGATYSTNLLEIPEVWLCNITKLIFNGQHPKHIYIQ